MCIVCYTVYTAIMKYICSCCEQQPAWVVLQFVLSSHKTWHKCQYDTNSLKGKMKMRRASSWSQQLVCGRWRRAGPGHLVYASNTGRPLNFKSTLNFSQLIIFVNLYFFSWNKFPVNFSSTYQGGRYKDIKLEEEEKNRIVLLQCKQLIKAKTLPTLTRQKIETCASVLASIILAMVLTCSRLQSYFCALS